MSVSPHNILKSHFIQLVDAITVPNKLATHLSKANLIAGAVERKVKTTPNLDDYDKASLLVNEVLKSLKVFNDPETLSQFCDVLKKQEDPDLKRIADIMLDELEPQATPIQKRQSVKPVISKGLGEDDIDDGVSPNVKVFISYRRKNKQKVFAQDLFDQLKEQNVDVWKDNEDMHPGDALPKELAEAINNCDLFVCVLSKEYFESKWCEKEIRYAQYVEKRLFPIHWGEDDLPDEFQFLLGDIIRHNYNPEAKNYQEELLTCVDKLMNVIANVEEINQPGNSGLRRRKPTGIPPVTNNIPHDRPPTGLSVSHYVLIGVIIVLIVKVVFF